MTAWLIHLTLFLLPTYLIRFEVASIPTNFVEVLAAVTIAIWLIESDPGNIKKMIARLPRTYLAGFTLIVSGLLISTFLNQEYRTGLGIIKSWFIVPALFSLAIFDQMGKNIRASRVLASILASGSVTAIISLVYKATGIVTYDHRLRAFYESPNHLAMFLAPALIIGVCFLIFRSPGRSEKISLPLSLGLTLACMTILAATFWTYSYATWLAITIGLIFIFLLSRKLKLIVFLLLVPLLFFLTQGNNPKLNDALSLTNKSSLTSRMAIWKSAMKILGDNPIWGIGPGSFQKKYLEYQVYFPPYPEWAVPQPHNLYLAFWLQAGLIGLVGFLTILIKLVVDLFTIYREAIKSKLPNNYPLVMLGLLVYMLVHGLIDTPYWKNDLAFLFWATVAMGMPRLGRTN